MYKRGISGQSCIVLWEYTSVQKLSNAAMYYTIFQATTGGKSRTAASKVVEIYRQYFVGKLSDTLLKQRACGENNKSHKNVGKK